MNIDLVALIITGVIALVAVLGLVYTHYKELSQIRERIAKLETKVEPFWAIISQAIPELLKALLTKSNPLNKETRDLYLDKLKKGTITYSEAKELNEYLQEELKRAQETRDALLFIAIILGLTLLTRFLSPAEERR